MAREDSDLDHTFPFTEGKPVTPTQTYAVIRYDVVAPDGRCTSRKPVLFTDRDEAIAYVKTVRDAIDRWGDNSLVGLYEGKDHGGKCIPVNR